MSTADPVPAPVAPASAQVTADPALPYEKKTCSFCSFIPGRTNRPSREVGRTITACFSCYDTYILTRAANWGRSGRSLAEKDAFLQRAKANYEAEKQEILESHLDTKECYCGYADPGFPGDSRCFPCQAKEQRIMIEQNRKARLQSQMEDGNPAKVFSEAQIADMSVQADANGFNRVLLRDIRRLRGLFG